ncbi:Dual oxidase maturation factor 1 [Orchesella cincta]|uniref:Dual oxidase maturation factor 1 n=1 Tax=Orchesella cincta TaxID=48709 RepID=A0A1D2N8B6_ORCCI|nr:Dual oxidase maturation factor 1 [Orchesella cincta]
MRNATWNYPWWFFSLARWNPGGPAWYGEDNRLVPTMYLQRSFLGIIAAALTFMLVLIIVLPIIRHRLHSIITAVNSLAIGVTIALCLICPEWIRGHGEIQSPLDYFSPEPYEYGLGVHIGLASFNVTLTSVYRDFDVAMNGSLIPVAETDGDLAPEIFYNERVKMFVPSNFEGVMEKALDHGLPIPILTVYDCLLSATMGFDWSHRILEAGYHVYLILVFALVGWFIAILLVAAIPRYGCYAFIAVGILMIFASVVYFYWAAISEALPCIVIGDTYVELRYGICFWASLIMGLWSTMYGFTLAVYDVIYPDKFLTIFDLDYDHKRALNRAHRFNYTQADKDLQYEFD